MFSSEIKQYCNSLCVNTRRVIRIHPRENIHKIIVSYLHKIFVTNTLAVIYIFLNNIFERMKKKKSTLFGWCNPLQQIECRIVKVCLLKVVQYNIAHCWEFKPVVKFSTTIWFRVLETVIHLHWSQADFGFKKNLKTAVNYFEEIIIER